MKLCCYVLLWCVVVVVCCFCVLCVVCCVLCVVCCVLCVVCCVLCVVCCVLCVVCCVLCVVCCVLCVVCCVLCVVCCVLCVVCCGLWGCGLLVVGCWLLVVGCWLLVVGCWLLVVGCWLLVVGCWLLVVGCWLLVVGCWRKHTVCWCEQARPSWPEVGRNSLHALVGRFGRVCVGVRVWGAVFLPVLVLSRVVRPSCLLFPCAQLSRKVSSCCLWKRAMESLSDGLFVVSMHTPMHVSTFTSDLSGNVAPNIYGWTPMPSDRENAVGYELVLWATASQHLLQARPAVDHREPVCVGVGPVRDAGVCQTVELAFRCI